MQHLVCTPLWLRLAWSATMLYCSAAVADWGGTASTTAAQTSFDTTEISTVDQYYTVNANGRFSQSLNYRVGLFYRNLQSGSRSTFGARQTEWQPTAAAQLRTAAILSRADFTYRDVHDDQNVNSLQGHSATLYSQTRSTSWPQLTGRYQWAKNANDLDLQGYDTRFRNAGIGALFSRAHYSLNYERTAQVVENNRTQVDRKTDLHNGRADATVGRLDSWVSTQASYQILSRKESEVQHGNSTALIPIPPAQGLFSVDISPEFGALDFDPGLIDGDVIQPTSTRINLLSGEAHNIGLEFPAEVMLNALYLYADSNLTTSLRWSIWVSNDNLTWTEFRSIQTYTFNAAFKRIELDLGSLLSRYVKIVEVPELNSQTVLVTELRAFSVQSSTDPKRTTDHRLSSTVNVRLHKNVNARIAGDWQTIKSGVTAVGRTQTGVNADVFTRLADPFDLAGQYQFSKASYDLSATPELTMHQTGLTLSSRWAEPLQTRLNIARRTEFQNQVQSRKIDEGRATCDAILFPKLRARGEIVTTRDDRFDEADELNSLSYSLTTSSQPLAFIDVQTEWRLTQRESKRRNIPANTRTMALRGNVELSSVLRVNGDFNRTDEPGLWDLRYDLNANWTATTTITLAAGFDHGDRSDGRGANQWSAQCLLRPSERWDISATYTYTQNPDQTITRSSRVGLNALL